MELIGFARGELRGLEEWMNLLRSAFWPRKAKDAQGNIHNVFGRTSVSPIIPMSIIFPEKSRDFVLGMVKPEGNQDYILDKGSGSYIGWKGNLVKKQLKSSLGLEDLPENWKKFDHPITEFMKNQKVGFHAIGIKRDRIDADGIEFL